MKYTTVYVRQLTSKGKPWQARAKYKDGNGKWQETAKTIREAKGKKDAERISGSMKPMRSSSANRLTGSTKSEQGERSVIFVISFEETLSTC